MYNLVLIELEKNLKDYSIEHYNLYSKIGFLYDFLNKKTEKNYKLEILEIFYNLKDINNFNIDIELYLRDRYKDKLINILFIYIWYKNIGCNEQIIFQKIENDYKNSSEYRNFKLNLPKINEIIKLQDVTLDDVITKFDRTNNKIDVVTSEYFDFVELEYNSMCQEVDPYNSRNEIVIRVCVEGALFYSYNNSSEHILLKKGDAFLVNQFILNKTTFLTERCKLLIFRVKSPFISEILNKKFERNSVALITLYRISYFLDHYKDVDKDVILLKILSNIVNHNNTSEVSTEPFCCKDLEFAEIISYINYNINKGITVREIEKKYKLYNKILVNKFKKYLNISPSEYLAEQKLLKAALILKTTEYKVNYISDMLSFTSANSFTISFKNKFGVTPLKYRNK